MNVRQLGLYALAQQAVLAHGKTMAVGQRQHEGVGMKSLHRADCADAPVSGRF